MKIILKTGATPVAIDFPADFGRKSALYLAPGGGYELSEKELAWIKENDSATFSNIQVLPAPAPPPPARPSSKKTVPPVPSSSPAPAKAASKSDKPKSSTD